jgi:hypothetical protein
MVEKYIELLDRQIALLNCARVECGKAIEELLHTRHRLRQNGNLQDQNEEGPEAKGANAPATLEQISFILDHDGSIPKDLSQKRASEITDAIIETL